MGSGKAIFVGREEVTAADVANLKSCGVDIASIATQLLHLNFIAYLWFR